MSMNCSFSELSLGTEWPLAFTEVSQDGGYRHLAKSSLKLFLYRVSLSCFLLRDIFSTHVCPPSFLLFFFFFVKNGQCSDCNLYRTWRKKVRDPLQQYSGVLHGEVREGEGGHAGGCPQHRPGAACRSGLNGATEHSSRDTAASDYFTFSHSVR